jgi:hypothetical protein
MHHSVEHASQRDGTDCSNVRNGADLEEERALTFPGRPSKWCHSSASIDTLKATYITIQGGWEMSSNFNTIHRLIEPR